ncbi:hypothetical protein PG994_013037 [Apiospora phragmitis]|uniref:OTU domain-containing protein n=1 Tax=Apiospora phragmitis TaxID=2905665 RepID=A0ABR1T7I2_9PEZI
MASETSQGSSPVGTKRKFDETQLLSRSPYYKRRQCSGKDSNYAADVDHDDTTHDAIAAPATGSSSPLSEVSDDRVPSAEEYCRLEQERLTCEKENESPVRDVIEVKTGEEDDLDKLQEKLKATLAQIKTANEGWLTPEVFEYLQSEVTASTFYLPEPTVHNAKTEGVDAATNTRKVIKLVRSLETQTDVVPGTTTAIQTPASAFEAAATQTERSVSDASVQTDPIPKTFPSADEVFKNDLKYIRRATPFVPSTNVITIKCRLREKQTNTPSASRIRKPSYLPSPSRTQNSNRFSTPRTSNSKVVSLVDDDDDDVSMVETNGDNWRTGGSRFGSDFAYGNMGGLGGADELDGYEGGVENVEFYGIQGTTSSTRSSELLRYQDRQNGVGEFPSPMVGLRLRKREYLLEIGSKHWTDPISRATSILQESSSWGNTAPMDDKEAIKSNWTKRGSYQLYKGFPLVEDIEFIVHRNNPPDEPDGDCYWRSVSFCLYGSDEHWNVVKAEHLEYLHHVLTNPQHPRYNLYREHLNGRFFDTSSVDGVTFKANIWQLLHLAHAWTPAVVSQITADLYNICVVIFTMENGVATETNVRGVYNSRHILLCFTGGCHFQPMTPNEYDAWEFKYPRITVDATAKYINAPKTISAKQTWEHPWRKEFSSTVLPPVPRLHGCNIQELRHYLGSNPRP